MKEQPETDILEEVVEQLLTDEGSQLIIFNDDVNTFDFVIDCLVDICGHDNVQAEQCAWIIHLKGKCSVKEGGYPKLEPLCTALCDKGLSAEIH